MICSLDLLSIYLGLELASLGIYVIASSRRGSAYSTEAGLKYYRRGSRASALLLYGLSLLYASIGTLNLQEAGIIVYSYTYDYISMFSFILIVITLLFKLGVVPFHR